MNSEFDTYIRKLRYYKELYLIDEEAYGDNNVNDLKVVLDDFIKYVELASSIKRPSQQGNWCDPFFVDQQGINVMNNNS